MQTYFPSGEVIDKIKYRVFKTTHDRKIVLAIKKA